jgi:flavin-dependent dehydrogenase
MEIFWGSRLQAYVTPTGPEEVCVVVMSEQRQHASFDLSLAELPQLQARLAGSQPVSRERGAVSVMCSLANVQRGSVALLGDASGGVDAITGEGLGLAFRQAFALADAMAAGDLAQYQKSHRALAHQPLLMGRLMLWLGRHPQVRARALCTLQRNPDLFARFVATHAGQGTSAELVSASASLSWRLLAV